MVKPAVRRCAIYTRKSTEEGLEQEFSTLDAQREAAEAYISSQQGDGWIALPDRYDDGGFTGANTDRPGLQKLLGDIQDGKIDCVVVYKVDRLNRSLLDFAQMMKTFDCHQIAFVAVTQQINTASSAGRLMLNVLLSFAQFERELIAERTRDKMGAARRKGKWLGSAPVLGYDVDRQKRRLVVNPDEAAQVQQIYELYLARESLRHVVDELRRRGWRNKRWQTKRGEFRGGREFTKATLQFVLTNVTYLGKVRYQQATYRGEHEAILDASLFKQVQRKLKANRNGNRSTRPARIKGALQGRLFCGVCAGRMQHTYTSQGKRRYRYYTCRRDRQLEGAACGPAIPAAELEGYVRQQTIDFYGEERLEASIDIADAIRRIDYHCESGDLRIQFHAPVRQE